ncbi:MAG: hypothetical protein AAGD25_34615 [Cyanobacteria bacterium P01_F01_bin.150]
MRKQHHGRNLLLLTLLFLISACDANTASTDESLSGANNGADTAVVAEAPAASSSSDSSNNAGSADSATSKEAQTPATALQEEETGVADLREIVDEIAPEPEKPSSDNKATDTASKTDDETEVQDASTVMVALTTEGLQTVDAQTGSTVDMAFDTVDQAIIVSTVSSALGDPTETIDTSECPAGPLQITTWTNGLSINTLDKTFVGWSINPNAGSEDLTTIAGVGIGTSVKDLQDAYDVEILDSTLGTEFYVGQMSGLLSSEQPDGEITDLWAGANCIFR